MVCRSISAVSHHPHRGGRNAPAGAPGVPGTRHRTAGAGAKLLALPGGELLVAEAGAGANTGRISHIDRDARRFTVIDGLPSALFLGRDASGPSGLVLGERRLYVTIGGGDTTIAGNGANSEIPNPAVSSPLFSWVLLLEFPDAAGAFSTWCSQCPQGVAADRCRDSGGRRTADGYARTADRGHE